MAKRQGAALPSAVLVASLLLSGCVRLSSGNVRSPWKRTGSWRSQVQFWQITEVGWSPPEEAVFATSPARDACHCSRLCLMARSCVAADLVEAAEGFTCRLASRRGNNTDNTTTIAGFVRRGRAELDEHCLTDDECWQGQKGTDCVDGVCTCRRTLSPLRGRCVISDCSGLRALGVTVSGQYWVRLDNDSAPTAVFCDMKTDGGGWTVFQRRQDDAEQISFYRDWQNYRDGFGNVYGQFWLGNEVIHRLTARQPHQLRIDLEDFEGNHRSANYGTFLVADEEDGYRLTVADYDGDAGDSLYVHNGQQFSTKDRYEKNGYDCPKTYKGAWWYKTCHSSNLNGYYCGKNCEAYGVGINWSRWKDFYYSLKRTEMKLKPL